MAAESFFNRWSKQKADSLPDINTKTAVPVSPATSQSPNENTQDQQAISLPTMEDVAALTHGSDYSPYMASGVDETIKRSAMKKLFSDPHFNIMDGLDIYIGDYNTFEPIPPEMLAMLNHAKALLDPLSQFEKPLMQLIDKVDQSDLALLKSEEETANETLAADQDKPSEAEPDTDSIASEKVESSIQNAAGNTPVEQDAHLASDTSDYPKDAG